MQSDTLIVPDTPSQELVPMLAPNAPQVLDMFAAALESSLIERGAVFGVVLLGSADAFWRKVPLLELQRMAAAGNDAAQAELAWRYAEGLGLPKSHAQALAWATRSAEQQCA